MERTQWESKISCFSGKTFFRRSLIVSCCAVVSISSDLIYLMWPVNGLIEDQSDSILNFFVFFDDDDCRCQFSCNEGRILLWWSEFYSRNTKKNKIVHYFGRGTYSIETYGEREPLVIIGIPCDRLSGCNAIEWKLWLIVVALFMKFVDSTGRLW